MALSAYRHLLRATRIAFQGDARLLSSARHEARKNFETNRSLDANSKQAVASIAHAEDVARILRHNIVQGQKSEVEGKGENYRLRIHKDIERGDNEAVKVGASIRPGTTDKSCSS